MVESESFDSDDESQSEPVHTTVSSKGNKLWADIAEVLDIEFPNPDRSPGRYLGCHHNISEQTATSPDRSSTHKIRVMEYDMSKFLTASV